MKEQASPWKCLKHFSCCQVSGTIANVMFLPHEGAPSFDSSFLNGSRYETYFVIPLTSDLYSFFLFWSIIIFQ